MARSVSAPARRSPAGLVAALALAAALVVGSAWLPTVGTTLAAEAELRPADAIVLTYAAMMVPEGLVEAERLYRGGWAGTIALSDFQIEQRGWDFDRLEPLTRRRLVRRGIPADALVSLPSVPAHEVGEAQALRDLFAARGWRSVLLVVRDYRTLRTTATLRHAIGDGAIDLIPRPVPEPDVDLARWWTTPAGLSAVANEWPRLVYYRVRGRL
jgi:uncharacterized SAM-binding protein YcdF (DUF218 family)